jgi:16S rRNA processing protein RimM
MLNTPLIGSGNDHSNSTPDDLIEVGRVLNAYGLNGSVKVQPFSPTADTLLTSKRWWLVSLASPNFVFYQVKSAKSHSGSIVVTFDPGLDRNQAEALKGQRIWVSRADFPQTQQDEYYWIDLIGCDVFTDAESNEDTSESDILQTTPSATADTTAGTATDTTAGTVAGTAAGTTADTVALATATIALPSSIKKIGVVDEVLDHSAHAVLSVRQQTQDAQGQWVDILDAKGRAVTTLIPFVAAHVTAVDIKARTIHTNWPLDF